MEGKMLLLSKQAEFLLRSTYYYNTIWIFQFYYVKKKL